MKPSIIFLAALFLFALSCTNSEKPVKVAQNKKPINDTTLVTAQFIVNPNTWSIDNGIARMVIKGEYKYTSDTAADGTVTQRKQKWSLDTSYLLPTIDTLSPLIDTEGKRVFDANGQPSYRYTFRVPISITSQFVKPFAIIPREYLITFSPLFPPYPNPRTPSPIPRHK